MPLLQQDSWPGLKHSPKSLPLPLLDLQHLLWPFCRFCTHWPLSVHVAVVAVQSFSCRYPTDEQNILAILTKSGKKAIILKILV
jgi:hypothetical protein